MKRLVLPTCAALAALVALAACSGAPSSPTPVAPSSTLESASTSPTTASPSLTTGSTAAAPTKVETTTAPAPTKTAAKPAEPKLGQRQTTDLGQATVYDVDFPVDGSAEARDIRSKGKQFAVADIKVCANGSEDDDGYNFDASNFELTDKNDRTYDFWNVQIGARSPNLMDSVNGSDAQRKGSCKRGWLTFELPPKTKVESVDYNPSSGEPLTWRVRD